jgi:2-keto-myo-inositol isomerase
LLDAATARLDFAINHMAAPQLDLAAFFALARSLGMTNVEIRNDITGKPILDGTPARAVRAAAAAAGVRIVTINALQRFNDWTLERRAEAETLADYASECDAAAIILVPTNDGSGRAEGERQDRLVQALTGLRPILLARGITGLVEPLGFEACSLRLKREAVDGIASIGVETVFKVTHDTFHHHLAGEAETFASMTGLIHISGVDNDALEVSQMRDAHRVLVGPKDRLGNVGQIRSLLAGGYQGPVSFEPFAEELRLLADPAVAIRESMNFISSQFVSRQAPLVGMTDSPGRGELPVTTRATPDA